LMPCSMPSKTGFLSSFSYPPSNFEDPLAVP
jgi:hypothetical protein